MLCGRTVRIVLASFAVAVPLAGCGSGGNDQAKVEADLQRYMLGMRPEQTGFPMGLGPPKVQANSCRDRNIRVEKRDVMWSSTSFGIPVGSRGALWGCVVKLGAYVTRVHVLVADRTRVVREWQGQLIRTKCMGDQKAKGMPERRAFGICAVVDPPIGLRKSEPKS